MSFIKEFQHLQIPLQDLKSATNDFADSNCIGRGGFGKVYKGEILLSGVLTVVAVKRLDRSLGQGKTEFWKEITMLHRYKHENLVTLLGFCDEGGESLLVYEYLSKKSLDQYLSHPKLSWYDRLSICYWAAEGLKFLHEPTEGSQHRVLHRDIKSANILLDDDGVVKISDLGLSKLGPANQEFSFLFSNAVGTPGYCDPLYARTGFLTKESDVYSFGVVMFEVLCGRPTYVPDYKDIRKSLVSLACKCYEEKTLDTIILSGIRETISPKSLERFSATAYQCLHMDHERRPSMAKIVEDIEIAHLYQLLYESSLLEVPSKEIEVATENFKTSIGEGIGMHGHRCYIGQLSIFGKPTAVIVIKRSREHYSGLAGFLQQIWFLHKNPHPNVMSIIGFYAEEKEMISIFEYPDRGRLDQYINTTSTTTLTWLQRLKICIDAAQGLYHFHTYKWILSEFTSANVLLDDKWVAKVFNGIKTTIEHAYMAPESIMNDTWTKEADVYSFGMVLIEVLCKDVDGYILSAKLIKELYEKKKLNEMVDPSLREQKIGSYSVEKYSGIAYKCLLDDPKDRPSLDVVIKELQELMRIEILREDPRFVGIIERLEIAIKYQGARSGAGREREESGPEETSHGNTTPWCERPHISNPARGVGTARDLAWFPPTEFDSHEYGEFNYEHGKHKLSFDLEGLIKSLNFLGANVTEKKVLWLLHKGVFNGKKFVSISDNGVSCELISARAFLYPSSKTYEWESSKKFRFSEVARIPNKEKLNIRCRISTSLSSGIMYAASLVFSFQREPQIMHGKSSHLMTINWKCEGLLVASTHFAEQTEDGWMKVRLWHFVHGGESSDFDIILDKISYFEEDELPSVFIHGIEFEPAEMTGETERLEDVSISGEDGNWKKWIASDCEGVNYISNKHLEYTSQTPPKKLYFRLCAGILIENGQKLFSLCKSTGGKCHMLPAIEVFTNDAHFDKLSLPESRFNEVIQLQAVSSCSFECELDPDMLSRGHVYACYLVFKFAEPHVWNHYTRLVRAYCRLDTEETGMLFAHLNSPENVNIPTIIPKNHDGSHDSSNTPITKDPIMRRKFMDECVHSWMEPRNDGWMEVILSKSLHKLENHKSLSMTLISRESDFYGIIVQGIEFRPLQRNIL